MGVDLIPQRTQFGVLRRLRKPRCPAFGHAHFSGHAERQIHCCPRNDEEIAGYCEFDDLLKRGNPQLIL